MASSFILTSLALTHTEVTPANSFSFPLKLWAAPFSTFHSKSSDPVLDSSMRMCSLAGSVMLSSLLPNIESIGCLTLPNSSIWEL